MHSLRFSWRRHARRLRDPPLRVVPHRVRDGVKVCECPSDPLLDGALARRERLESVVEIGERVLRANKLLASEGDEFRAVWALRCGCQGDLEMRGSQCEGVVERPPKLTGARRLGLRSRHRARSLRLKKRAAGAGARRAYGHA